MMHTALGLLLTPLLTLRAAQSGCGTTHITGKTNGPFTISSSGGDRQYIIHVPTSYQSSQATPLIVSYHGNHRTMYEQETLSQFSNETLNPDMLVVYPQGLNVGAAEYYTTCTEADSTYRTHGKVPLMQRLACQTKSSPLIS